VTILDEILSTLAHDAPVRLVERGERATAVWGPRLGVAYHFPEQGKPPPAFHAGARGARELSLLARSRDPGEASIGVAAVNSLLDPPPGLPVGNAFELVAERGAGKDVALVGHFSFVEKLRAIVRNLWVLELAPEEGDLPASEAPRVLPRADLIAITGSTLVNHTLDGLLELARGRAVILLGASTVFSPVFFDHGIFAVCGAVVDDPESVLRGVRSGLSFRQTAGLRKLLWTVGG
jgi:uncharacterized protein (DUF4213/DUF364 family)